jgi:hypothetical protein
MDSSGKEISSPVRYSEVIDYTWVSERMNRDSALLVKLAVTAPLCASPRSHQTSLVSSAFTFSFAIGVDGGAAAGGSRRPISVTITDVRFLSDPSVAE